MPFKLLSNQRFFGILSYKLFVPSVIVVQRSKRLLHLLVMHLANIVYLTAQCWPNLLWGRFNKTLHVMVATKFNFIQLQVKVILTAVLRMLQWIWKSYGMIAGEWHGCHSKKLPEWKIESKQVENKKGCTYVSIAKLVKKKVCLIISNNVIWWQTKR